ncbi:MULTISPECIES: hypothetical protein [Planktothricoides]|uniref:Holin n=2 Tax=Planktothricoides raciborskii TaxID=132608 RepID=A0AAU8JG76_9CYAN|nr:MULTISPECIES: hypothetical protein [Planktothricoides]KOR34325.1 hypothetical protein AM228_24675 [Planktothricoides sp. SR001]MBD2545652.1 hypothetical protein [Planktothricoides raciborskii FACHB-1370]MBD2585268.1 hypothetical protein [Planktothricoides raciborskii FACHB-1261]
MFMDELTPVLKELTQYPVAFLGGFVSGLLGVKLTDDPVKSWLQEQGVASTVTSNSDNGQNRNGGSSSGPQSISID